MNYEAYISHEAFEKAREHFKRHEQRGLEALGLLLGKAYKWQGREYVIVEEYATAENDATAVSVRFTEEAFEKLAGQLGERTVVGWAHSHPGYGCFLSSTDLRTQKAFFNERYHIALVCDPKTDECKAFKLDGEDYRPAPYAVIKRK